MYTIALVLVLFWLLGAVQGVGGELIHIVFVVAVVLVLIRLVNQGGVVE